MMFDKDGSRSLSYDQFSRFIINVVAAAPEHITFVDIADTITRFAIEGDEHDMTIERITEMFAMDNSMKYVMNLEAATQEEVDTLKAVQIGRVNKLFDCWDLDRYVLCTRGEILFSSYQKNTNEKKILLHLEKKKKKKKLTSDFCNIPSCPTIIFY